MKRTGFGILTALTVATASCAGGAGGADGALRVQITGEQEEIVIYESLAEAFEREHADVEVTLVPIADKTDHLTKLSTSFAAGDPPDVFLVNFREYSQFVARGSVEPAGPLMARLGVDLDDYYDVPIEAFTYRGRLQCMPQNISNLVVYYNVQLFERAGLDRPPGDWTWEDFRAYARELTSGDVYGLGISPEIIRIAPFVWSNGGEMVDDSSSPTRFTLDEPQARAALDFVLSLVRDDRVVPTEREVAAQDLESRFVAGKLGMLLESRKVTPAFREVIGLDWDVLPLPAARDRVSILHSDAYCIAAGTGDISAAARFVAFAVGEEGALITALGGRTVPSLIDVAESNAFLDPTRPPEHSQVWLDQAPRLRLTPVIPTWPEIEDVSEELLTRAFYESGYTIDDLLEDLAEQTGPLFEEGAD